MINCNSADIFPILDIQENGVLLSKSGSISVCYYLNNPEAFSLSPSVMDLRINEFFRSFKGMRDNTLIHKQDVYLRKQFDANIIGGNGFLPQADKAFFDKKNYVEHRCILTFSIFKLSSLESAYLKNPFKYKDSLLKADLDRLNGFFEDVKNVVTILNNLSFTSLIRLNSDELRQHLYSSLNGYFEDNFIRDIEVGGVLTVGAKKGAFFAVCDSNYLPDEISSYVENKNLATTTAKIYTSFFESFGIHFHYSHVINQFWKFDSYYKSEFESDVRKFGQHRFFDKEIEKDYKELDALLTEVVDEGNVIVSTHLNVFLIEENALFDKCFEEVKSRAKIIGVNLYIPTQEGLMDVFVGSLIGNAHKLNKNYFYLTDLKSSFCLMVNESTFKQDKKGIFFNDRLFNAPLKVDLWNGRKGHKLPARNAIFLASTGGGKSVTAGHCIEQFVQQGFKVVVVEFGKSFYSLTKVYDDISLHVDYNENTALGIDSFAISGTPSKEKINTLTNLVFRFWRTSTPSVEKMVAVRDIIIDYFENVVENRSFEDFYFYVKANISLIKERKTIADEYFDEVSFVHVCKEFVSGGYYENICKASELGRKIEEKDFIVFELTQVKKDAFLVDIIMSVLLDVIETKLLDKESKGLLVFDEYAETQQLKDNLGENKIHSTVAFCYQKLRKENSAVWTIIQSPVQLRDDEYSRGMIDNTQILIVLPTTESVYKSIVETFTITDESLIELMKSQKNNFEGDRRERYSEVYIRMMDLYGIVTRISLSPERFLAFQTEGEMWKELQKEEEKTNIKDAILTLKNKYYESEIDNSF